MSKESECIVRWDKEYSKIFEALFENTFIPCALLDSSFNFISVNKAYAEIDNRKPSDFVGKNHFELYPSDAEKIFREVVVTKKPYQVYARPFIYALNPERGITYWDWSLTPVINERQEVDFLVLTLYDVTQRVKALEELDNFCNLSVDLLGIMDFHGRLIKVNGYFEKILGYGKGELKDTLLFNLIHAEDRSEMEHVFYKSLESGEPVVNIENRCRHKSKDHKDIQWVIVPNKNNRICYVVGHDITENKKIQAELNRLESLSLLGTITAEINHELRNPLATVRGFLQLMLEKKDCQKYKDYLELMVSELDRAKSIITDYLSLAKVSQVKLEKRDLNEIIKKALLLVKASKPNLAVRFETSLGRLPKILADEKLITQLVINLVQNGIEAMAQQGTIKISTYLEQEKVVLAVKDHGHGIDPNLIDKLGTPFLTTKENGVGLGLPICYRIVKNHNGEMEVKTGRDGTTFLVRFNQA